MGSHPLDIYEWNGQTVEWELDGMGEVFNNVEDVVAVALQCRIGYKKWDVKYWKYHNRHCLPYSIWR